MLRLQGLCLCLWLATAQVPMGPGSMQPYAGGGGRQRSYGYVREPAMGFFIAGSTLREMCYCAPFLRLPHPMAHDPKAHVPSLVG